MDDKSLADVASQTVDKLASGAKAIADAAERVAPHAWEIAVRQQRLEGIGDIVTGLAVVVALFVLAYAVLRVVRRVNREETYLEEAVGVARLLCLVVGLIVGVPVLNGYVVSGVQELLNPEYYAAQALIKAVK